MKKKNLCLYVVIACLACHVSSNGQTLVSPTKPDQTWYTSCGGPGYISYINTAMIHVPENRYGNNGFLMVSDYAGNGTGGGISFRDYYSGNTVNIPYCTSGNYMTATPDIIVGDDKLNPTTDFDVAAFYYNYSTGAPQIDYYLVHYTSSTTFTVTSTGSTTFPTSNTTTTHIDIIAEYGNTSATGYPWCDQFIVTWDDINTSASYAAIATLSAPPSYIGTSSPTATLLGPSSSAGFMIQPDVAAIQRIVGPCPSCNVDEVGLFVSTDQNDAAPYYQEYDFTTGLFITFLSIQLDYANYSSVYFPRIDAPDNYNINATTTGNSYFKAVAQATTPGGSVLSNTYDNTAFGTPMDDGFYLPGTPWSPTVAFGGANYSEYQVSHYVDEYGGTGSMPNVYMEPIKWTAPTVIPAYYGLNQYYYQVNSTAPSFVNGNCLNSISTPCNDPASLTLCAWADYDLTSLMSTVHYKVTPYGGTYGYTFRHAAPNTQSVQWAVYPNPASSVLTVDYAGTKGQYTITDVLGRSMAAGELQTGTQHIDINSLVPGTYIIASSGDATNCATFVKQ